MSENKQGPVAWQQFGKEWCLTGQYGMRPIILAVRKGALTSLVDGLLRPFDPNHPDARRLVACWNACQGISTEALETPRGMAGAIEPIASALLVAKNDRADLIAFAQKVRAANRNAHVLTAASGALQALSDEASALLARFPKEGAPR